MIVFQSGGCLITDCGPVRLDAIRLHVSTLREKRRRTLPGMYPSANQRQPAGFWSPYRKKRSLETREEFEKPR